MRVYAVSILALSPVQDTTAGEIAGTYAEHTPALIPAASIEAAAEQAKAHAFERWKPTEGWYGHQAAIVPAPPSFYAAVLSAREAGILDQLQDEPGQIFQFQS